MATTVRYTVDAENRLTSVDDEWLSFARANEAEELNSERVLGTSLLDFIAGTETRYLYQTVFERVREHDTPIILPFRCDSPETRRFMRIVISPLFGGSLQLDVVLVREQHREPVRLLARGDARSEEILTMCSWCKKAWIPDGEWLEIEDAIVRMDLFSTAQMPEITHGICPSCEREVTTALDAAAAST
jgi:hypothetical protein